MKLEELLNELIKLGWKPWGKPIEQIETDTDKMILYMNRDDIVGCDLLSLNDLCSIESWLWAFVVKNSLYSHLNNDRIVLWDSAVTEEQWIASDETYRLMRSSIQEDKSRFLLDSIKIPWNDDLQPRCAYDMRFKKKIRFFIGDLESLQSTEQEELDKRDNDLCNIHNSKLDRGDMYMKIIDYLVWKWFLQEWKED